VLNKINMVKGDIVVFGGYSWQVPDIGARINSHCHVYVCGNGVYSRPRDGGGLCRQFGAGWRRRSSNQIFYAFIPTAPRYCIFVCLSGIYCFLLRIMTRTHISLYWKCQLIGWSAASFYWGYAGFLSGGYILWIGLLQFLSDVMLYVFITHLYHRFALRRGWQQLGMNSLIQRLIPAVLLLAMVFLLVTAGKVYLFRLWLFSGNIPTFTAFLQTNSLTIFMAGVRLMCIWLLGYHQYYYGKREMVLAAENARLALIAKDAQLNNLHAQLNPHFLFNSLNTIKALVLDDPSSARRAIDLMSDLLRLSLYHQELIVHPLKEELHLVKDYLELEKLRLEERLRISIECAPELMDTGILRYSIQALVENAVKHGISRQKSGGMLRIVITRNGDFISAVVENPGSLNVSASSEGLGLKNLNERLQLYYQHKATLNISEANETVIVSILIPVV